MSSQSCTSAELMNRKMTMTTKSLTLGMVEDRQCQKCQSARRSVSATMTLTGHGPVNLTDQTGMDASYLMPAIIG